MNQYIAVKNGRFYVPDVPETTFSYNSDLALWEEMVQQAIASADRMVREEDMFAVCKALNITCHKDHENKLYELQGIELEFYEDRPKICWNCHRPTHFLEWHCRCGAAIEPVKLARVKTEDVKEAVESKKEIKQEEWSNDYGFLEEAKNYLSELGEDVSLEVIDALTDYIKVTVKSESVEPKQEESKDDLFELLREFVGASDSERWQLARKEFNLIRK